MAIGKRLKIILKAKGITVKDLAQNTGISENTLYGIIKRDNKTLSPDIAAKIVDYLGIPLNHLITFEEYIDTSKITFDNETKGKKMISLYESLNEEGKEKALEHIEMLVKIPEYRNVVDLFSGIRGLDLPKGDTTVTFEMVTDDNKKEEE